MSQEFDICQALLNGALVLLHPPPATSVVIPGNQVAWEVTATDTADGLLWARVAGSQGHNVDDCCVDYLVVTFGLGLLRCVPAIDEEGCAPPPDELTAAARQILDDQEQLRIAIQAQLCQKAPPKLSTLRWTPLGPDGGVGGGEWTFDVKVMV